MEYRRYRLFLCFLNIIAAILGDVQAKDCFFNNLKRISLRSSDPLTRRSAGEKHFIRFGRSESVKSLRFRNDEEPNGKSIALSKREIGSETNDFWNDKKYNMSETSSQSVLCLPVPEMYDQQGADHLVCLLLKQRNGTTYPSHFTTYFDGNENIDNFDNDDSTDEDGNDNVNESNDLEDNDMSDGKKLFFVNDVVSDRANKNIDKFVRINRSKFTRNLFSRYDRGRDNFMRLGRSGLQDGNKISETYGQRIARKYDNFIRLGRQKNIERFTRRYDANFMRLGRKKQDNCTEERDFQNSELPNQIGKRPSILSSINKQPFTKREKTQNFIRYGRNKPISLIDSPDDSPLTNIQNPKETYKIRRSNKFLRFGRSYDIDGDDKTTSYVILPSDKNEHRYPNKPNFEKESDLRFLPLTNCRGNENEKQACLAMMTPPNIGKTQDTDTNSFNFNSIPNGFSSY